MSVPTSLALEIVTPDHAILHEDVEEVELPGIAGYFGVLPGHAPLLASLGVGEMWYRRGTEKSYLSLAEGLAEILPDRVIVLARVAERAEDIDLTRAQMGVNRAEERLAKPSPDLDMERARIALIKQLTRVRVAQKARTRS